MRRAFHPLLEQGARLGLIERPASLVSRAAFSPIEGYFVTSPAKAAMRPWKLMPVDEECPMKLLIIMSAAWARAASWKAASAATGALPCLAR